MVNLLYCIFLYTSFPHHQKYNFNDIPSFVFFFHVAHNILKSYNFLEILISSLCVKNVVQFFNNMIAMLLKILIFKGLFSSLLSSIGTLKLLKTHEKIKVNGQLWYFLASQNVNRTTKTFTVVNDNFLSLIGIRTKCFFYYLNQNIITYRWRILLFYFLKNK